MHRNASHYTALQLHQNALATLRKDLSLDDADTLAYTQNKLKQAQIDFLNSQTKKKAGQITRQCCMRSWRRWKHSRTKSWFYVELSSKIQKQSR